MGVHTGDLELSDGDGPADVHGMPVVIARRLCDVAQAGQFLVSDVVRQLVGTRPELTMHDSASRDLKGVPDAVASWTVAWDPLPAYDGR